MTARREDALRLADMLRSIGRLEEIREAGYASFSMSWVSQSAVIRELEVLGEAAGEVSASLRKRHPEVEWARMRGFSSFAKHEYWRINPKLLWGAVEEMPRVREKVARVSARPR